MKRFMALFLTVSMFLSLGAITSVNAAGLKDYGARTTKTYQLTSAVYEKDVYSNWIRLTEPKYARRATEHGFYFKGATKEVTSSLNIGVPIKQVSAKLNIAIKNSVTTTINGDVSSSLEKGEYTAYYYRNHWKQYKVTYKVTEKTTFSKKGGGLQVKTNTYYKTERIKVAQKLNAHDYGWFYAYRAKDLPKTLNEKWCDDNYSCKVR